jgi:hypothetical protein
MVTPRYLALSVSAVVLSLLLAAIYFTAGIAGANVPAGPGYFDLNQYPDYRASEWGLPAPAHDSPGAWFDLRQHPAYWASEHHWTRPQSGLTAEQLYHDLMLVK